MKYYPDKRFSIIEEYAKLRDELADKHKIILLDADLGASFGSESFKKRYPDRYINCGISEQDMQSTAAGIAYMDKTYKEDVIALTQSFGIFAGLLSLEQVRQSIAHPKDKDKDGDSYEGLNVKIAARTGLVGEDGGSHHGIEDRNAMRVIPNMEVVYPADIIEIRRIMPVVFESKSPIYLCLYKGRVPIVSERKENIKEGEAYVLVPGDDVTIVSNGYMLHKVREASIELEKGGIRAEIISSPWIKPFDSELIIESAKKTNGVVIVEDCNIIGALGSAVCEILSENYPVYAERLGVQDEFVGSGNIDELLDSINLGAEGIYNNVKAFVRKTRKLIREGDAPYSFSL